MIGQRRMVCDGDLEESIVGLGLPSDNNFQPITRFVSTEMLGNEIVVGVTLHGYGGKHVTCFNFYIKLLKQSSP